MKREKAYRLGLAFLWRWTPAVFWMGSIFSASTDLMSQAHTSRFVEPFLRWLHPGISPEALASAHFLLRKSGHLSEYALLSILLWRAFAPRAARFAGDLQTEARRRFSFALLGSVLYAATDEFHQSFVASRAGSVTDVLIDAGGALLGLAVVWFAVRFLETFPQRTGAAVACGSRGAGQT